MNSKKERLLSAVVILLALVVLVSTVVYLITGNYIPGLMPLSQAALMVPMYSLWKSREPRWISYLFLVAGVLNVIAGILQIVKP